MIEGDKIGEGAADIDGYGVRHQVLLFKIPRSKLQVEFELT
jgi:hypothetical protein